MPQLCYPFDLFTFSNFLLLAINHLFLKSKAFLLFMYYLRFGVPTELCVQDFLIITREAPLSENKTEHWKIGLRPKTRNTANAFAILSADEFFWLRLFQR